jgi:hypothetical protein
MAREREVLMRSLDRNDGPHSDEDVDAVMARVSDIEDPIIASEATTLAEATTKLQVAPIGARWASDESNRRERWLGLRYYASVGLVVAGTVLQLYSTWPLGRSPA